MPFYCISRRLSYTEKDKLKSMLDCLLEKGIIRSITSKYASFIVLVTKKMVNQEFVNFRILNKVTVRDNYLLSYNRRPLRSFK